MPWANSKMFRQPIADLWSASTGGWTGFTGIDSDTPKVALYDDTITPDNDVTLANGMYAGGVWSATGGQTGTPQVYHTGQWAQGGVALAGHAITTAADSIKYDANDTASGAAATMSNIRGCLVYDDTVTAVATDFGICYNYFGGTTYSVTNGTLTVVWHATNGIWLASL